MAIFSISKMLTIIIITVIILAAIGTLASYFAVTTSPYNVTASQFTNNISAITGDYAGNFSGSSANSVNATSGIIGHSFNVFAGCSYGSVHIAVYGQNTSINNCQTGQPNATANGPFFSNFFQFSGAAFVFTGIGNMLLIMTNLGGSFGNLIGYLGGLLPTQGLGIAVSLIVKMVVLYVFIRIIMIGVSGFMKFPIWDS
jgi:hypothetical protein